MLSPMTARNALACAISSFRDNPRLFGTHDNQPRAFLFSFGQFGARHWNKADVYRTAKATSDRITESVAFEPLEQPDEHTPTVRRVGNIGSDRRASAAETR
jgi:hypothetical protein